MEVFSFEYLFRSRPKEESALWSCSLAHLEEPAELVRVPVAVAARKARLVPRETAALPLRAVQRRSPSSNRAVHHLASNSRHNRRKASNVDDIHIDADRRLSVLFAGVASSSL